MGKDDGETTGRTEESGGEGNTTDGEHENRDAGKI
jgi:hypothetical protein